MKPGTWEIRTTGVVQSARPGGGSVVAHVLRRHGIAGLSKRIAANDPAVWNELRANPALLTALRGAVDRLMFEHVTGRP